MVRMKWDTPPEPVKVERHTMNTKRRIDKEVRALRMNPGKWALVREDAASGAYMTYRKRGCTTRTKSLGGNRYAIWAKWDPESKEAQEWLRKYGDKEETE